ncbi:MAG: hypothetical protein RBR59_07180, partial [Sulfurimonadaceae bacterium]|nr:hypothetical protein [Sulfurimonadaceae bacterium]
MYKHINLITSSLEESEEFGSIVEHLKAHYKITPTLISHNEIFESSQENTLFLLYLSDNEIKLFFINHLTENLHIGIIPNKKCPLCIKKYALAKDIFEAIDDAFDKELLSRVDILMCNELVAFNRITIGSMRWMD